MFKRIIAAGLAVAMLLTQLPVNTYAADIGTTELAQEVVVTGEEAVTSEAIQPSEIVEIPGADVVVELPSEPAEEIVEVPTEETTAVEEISSEEITEEYISSDIQFDNEVAATSLREDIERVFTVEDPVDNYINFEAKFYGYGNYSEYSNEGFNYYVKISETADFTDYEQMWFKRDSSRYYDNEYVIILSSAFVGKANTTYYLDFVAYDYYEGVEISIATKEVTTKDEKVVTCDLQVDEPTSDYISYKATIYGFNNDLEENVAPGSYRLYVSKVEDFSTIYKDLYLNIYEVEVDNGIVLETDNEMLKAEANTTYYLKIVSYDYENGVVDCTPVVTVTTKDSKVYNRIFKVDEPEDNYVNVSLTIENYDNYEEYNSNNLDYQVQISVYEDFSVVEKSFYMYPSDIDDSEEVFLLGASQSYKALANTTYYVRLIEKDYNNDNETVLETVTVTTKNEKVYTGKLLVNEPEYSNITYTVELYNFDDWSEYYNSDFELYTYISETEDFAESEPQYINLTSKTVDGEYVLYTRNPYSFAGKAETTYYIKLVGDYYGEVDDIVFDTVQITTKKARELDADLGVDSPKYNVVNYDVELNGIKNWDDYDSLNTDFYVYVCKDSTFSSDVYSQYVSWWSTTEEDGSFKLYRDYTFEGEANTTYYFKLVGICGGVTTDYMTVYTTTKGERVTETVFTVDEPTSNVVTFEVDLLGFENWDDFETNTWEYYVYLSEDMGFQDYEDIRIYNWSSKRVDGEYIFYCRTALELEGNTTYYLKLVGEKNYEYTDLSDVVTTTTKDAKVIEVVFDVNEPTNNIIAFNAIFKGYSDWDEYEDMNISYYVEISADKNFYQYETIYFNGMDSYMSNGEFILEGNSSYFGEANTKYYVRLICYDRNSYNEKTLETAEVTTKDMIAYEGSISLLKYGAASANFDIHTKGLPEEIINDNVYLSYSEYADFKNEQRNGVYVDEDDAVDANEYSFNRSLTNITPEKTYYVRLIFVTGNWDEYVVLGNPVSFTTQANVTYTDADIPDPVLREAIKSEADSFDKIGLEGITYLNLSRQSIDEPTIKNLTGIGLLTSLNSLYVNYHEITDISPIANLIGLSYFRATDNKITTIPDLSALTNLTNLGLDGNYISKGEFTKNNTNIPSYFRNVERWWLSDTMESQRTGDDRVSLVVADTYYNYGDAYPLQVELQNTYQLNSYTLSIYEGDTVLVEKEVPHDDNGWYRVADWLYTDLITEAGTRNLTFVAYANDVEAARVTKAITFTTENIYMEDGVQRYIPTEQYSFYVYFNLFNDTTGISSVTLNAKDGSRVIYLSKRSSYFDDYDIRYSEIFDQLMIETSRVNYQYYTSFQGNAVLGNYDLVVTLTDGSKFTVEDYLTVTDSPLLSGAYTGDYSSDAENIYQYVLLQGYNIDWSKVYPVVVDRDGTELTSVVNYKITNSNNVVYKVKKLNSALWGNNVYIKLQNNSGTYIYNQDVLFDWYPNTSADIYYTEYDWVNKCLDIRTSNIPNGEYIWKLSWDDESEVLATATATITDGIAKLYFVDAEGRPYDLVDQYENYCFTIMQGTKVIARPYAMIRTDDVYPADDYSTNIDGMITPLINPGASFSDSLYMSKKVVNEGDSLTAILKNAVGEVITTGTAVASDKVDFTYIQFAFANVSLDNETNYGVEILKGETSLGTATYIILDPAETYYEYTDYETDYSTKTVTLWMYGSFQPNMDLSKITINVMDEEGNDIKEYALKNARFEDGGALIIGNIDLSAEWDTLKANYSWLYWTPYYNDELIKYAYLYDMMNEFYIGGNGAVTPAITTRVWTKYTQYGDYRVRQARGFYGVPNTYVNVSIYLPYETDALKTFTALADANGEYEFTSSDLAGLTINDNFKHYDIVLTDTSGKFLAVRTQNYLAGIESSVIEHMIFNKYELSLGADQSETLLVAVRPEAYYGYIVWASSNTSVATVDQEGKITAVGNGTAIITASVEGKTISCTVTVSGYVEEPAESTFVYDDAGRIVLVDANGNIDTTATGLMQCELAGNNWIYMNEGVFDTTKFDFVEFGGGQFFVVNGVLAGDISGLQYFDNKFYFLAYGQLQDYTGLALYDGEFFFVQNGVLAVDYNGLLDFDGSTFLIAAGRIVGDYTGLYNDAVTGKWCYIVYGQVQTAYTGLVMYDGAWFYLVNGVLASDYVGYVEYDGSQFYVQYGQVVG